MLGGGVAVGDRAWVGIGSTVKSGVTIGAGALVGVGAAVVNHIPPNVVAYGTPARVVKDLSE